jgi:DNA-binding NarL/FixJ family response regulator
MTGESAEAMPSALVVAAEEETRVLLRGLLRLHRFRIVGEAEDCVRAMTLVQEQAPATLVIDTTLAEGDAVDLADSAKRHRPETRVVIVARGQRPVIPAGHREPDAVLLRPFRIHDFALAVTPLATG